MSFEHDAARQQARDELVNVALAILAHHLDMVEGVRRINHLRFLVGEPDNEIFLPIRGIESETDDYPVGAARKLWSDEALDRFDREVADYLRLVGSALHSSCEAIIRRYS